MSIKFNRAWAMPNAETFSIKPIGDFVHKHIDGRISVDPSAMNKDWFTYTNDLNPNTKAQYHLDAEEFLVMLHFDKKVRADVVIIDLPYSPRQVSECYKGIGLRVGMEQTQTAKLYKRVRDAADLIVPLGGKVLSFGWNSVGMGKGRGYELEEILLCCHGGAHSDTICLCEVKARIVL